MRLTYSWNRIKPAAILGLLMALAGPLPAQVLYDAGLGTLPAGQGWSYLALPGTAQQSLTGGAARLDTSAQMAEKAGYFASMASTLDRRQGFAVLFTAQLHGERHNSTDRAGFSVIVLDEEKRGIELGFWTNQVFAQSDSPLFTHAESAALNTSAGPVDYALTFGPTQYVLRAQGTPILTGLVRDYTAFVGTYDPYETPNFLFFGDDTSSASGMVSLKRITLLTAPRLVMQPSGLLCWNGVSNQTYSVERSLDLGHWTSAGTAYSATGSFCFTNPAATCDGYFRVVWP